VVNGEVETYEPSISDTPSDNTPSIPLCPHGERENLRGVKPRYSEPSGAKRESEEEDHASSGITVFGGGCCVASIAGVETES